MAAPTGQCSDSSSGTARFAVPHCLVDSLPFLLQLARQPGILLAFLKAQLGLQLLLIFQSFPVEQAV